MLSFKRYKHSWHVNIGGKFNESEKKVFGNALVDLSLLK